MDYLPATIPPLASQASQADILTHLGHFKIQALNYSMATITGKDAKYLEPKEVKSLTDMVLNLEDSIKNSMPEGQQVRTVKRLLDKYAD